MKFICNIIGLAIPLGIIVLGLLAGIVAEKIIFRRLRHQAAATSWKSDDIILQAIGRLPVLWATIAAAYVAITRIPLGSKGFARMETALLVAAIFSVTVFIARAGAGLIALYAQGKQGLLPSASIFTRVIRLAVFIMGLLVILQTLGISITPIITALGIGGLAVSLALQDTLSNLFSGLSMTASRQVRPGDYIKLGSGEEGYVTDITWRSTTIRALPNNMIIVPNAKLASVIITNYYFPEQEMAVLVQVGVSYDSDLSRVEQVTMEVGRDVMREVQGGVPEFEPFIRYHTFSDYSINFSVILRGREFTDQYLLKHEFIKRLHARYAAEGIQIPFPIRTILLKEQRETR
jgi:small-conductance mechanosensitive channel